MMKEIGEAIGVSELRFSQVLSAAMAQLRARISAEVN
jgi:DNA-directed RNA polymerase specialized sigma subunit